MAQILVGLPQYRPVNGVKETVSQIWHLQLHLFLLAFPHLKYFQITVCSCSAEF